MPGIRFLYIDEDYQIHKIPQPKNLIYKAIPMLAKQDVLEVILYYETINRKPQKLLFVSFNRLTLDSKGQYEVTDDSACESIMYVMNLAFHTPESLSVSQKPLPIPTAITIPNQDEKESLKNYIRVFMPELMCNGFEVIESEIISRKNKNKANKKLVLDASKLRKK